MTISFASAWLAAEPRALALLPDRFRHRKDRAQAVADAAARPVQPVLLDVLGASNGRLAPSEARSRNLDKLSQSGTVAVVTGQQVGLFLGPLYTLYKAASAIVVARALEAETGRACVPIFWLQTEDHDLPEINTCALPLGVGGVGHLSLAFEDAQSSRTPVGRRTIGADVSTVLQAIREELASQPFTDASLAVLERAYRPGATLADAFAQLMAEIFADEGLIILDPRDPHLAPLTALVHRRALDDASSIADALARRGAGLAEAGFSEQVHIRPGAPLAFYSPDGPDGARFRLNPVPDVADRWRLVGDAQGREVTTDDLHGFIAREPARFTTSALLRPLLQDSWLPTAAYVGGPAEMAYFAQLVPLYERFDLPMPLAVPRARFRILDDRTRSLLEKVGLSADEASRPREDLLAMLARRASDDGFDTPESVEARILESIAPELSRLESTMAALDPSFSKAVARTQDTVRESVGRLVGKYSRAIAQRSQVTMDRLDRVRSYLLPDGAPQERVLGLPYFACRFGVRAFVRQILDETEPFNGALKDLQP